jgi:hypothetical protein
MVAAQSLLVPCGAKHYLAPGFFELEEAILDEVLLMHLVEGKKSWRPKLDIGGKNSLHPIDQEERSFSSGLGGRSLNGP